MTRDLAEQIRDALRKVAEDADRRGLSGMGDDITNAASAMDDEAALLLRRLIR